jgi:hypothetical protein
MAVTSLAPGKKLRRIVHCEPESGRPVPFDVTLTAKGIHFRRPGQENRKRLYVPWHIVLQNTRSEKKGFRVWSMSQAISYLSNVTSDPHACPCCHTKNAWKTKK